MCSDPDSKGLESFDRISLTSCLCGPQLSQKHKVGILLCRADQSTEEEMYNNEEATPAFTAFLELLGETVCLKGFSKYAAQLDTKSECIRVSRSLFLAHTQAEKWP